MERIDSITIGTRTVGAGAPVFVIAELSANHRQDLDEAIALVDAAADAGADAVKVQTFTPDTITFDGTSDVFEVTGEDWKGARLYDLYAQAYLPWEWHAEIQRRASERGLIFFSSPFDPTAIDLLEGLRVPAYKIASFELVDLALIAKAAGTGKPLLLSTGMGSVEEIAEALAAARAGGAREIALLRCTSAYPAPTDDLNLRTIGDMLDRFGVPVGFSDHTLGATAAVAAVAAGATFIEKHLTRSRDAGGPDASFSSEPGEFAALVREIRDVERALGRVTYEPSRREEENRAFRRSLFVVEDVRRGETFTEHNVRSLRPAAGLHPRHLAEVIGRTAARDLVKGTPLGWDAIDDAAQ